MKKEIKSSRIDYIDVFRSIGIILMVMGHIGFGETFDFFIHAFHMPMFFVISGFFYKPKSSEELPIGQMILKKSKSLLLPYVVFGAGHYLFYVLLNTHRGIPVRLDPLIHLCSTNTIGLPICGALWFLTALFFTDLIFFLLDRYIRNKVLFVIIVIGISLIGNFANIIFSFTLPFALSASFVGVGLYFIGYCLARSDKKYGFLKNMSWLHNVLLSILTIVLIFVNGYINMREGTYAIIPLFWLNSVLSTLVILNFSRLVYPFIEQNIMGRWLCGIGKCSIVYVCLNQIIIFIVTLCVNKYLVLSFVLAKILITVVVFGFLFIINHIIINTRLRILIGK